MAEGLNEVNLLGYLGAPGELRYTQGGQPVLNIRMATTESYLDRNKERQEHTEWHAVVVWGKRAEALAKILAKGSQIMVKGSLRSSSWEDKEGVKRYKTEVQARQIILCGGRPAKSRGGAPAPMPAHDPETGEVVDDDFGF